MIVDRLRPSAAEALATRVLLLCCSALGACGSFGHGDFETLALGNTDVAGGGTGSGSPGGGAVCNNGVVEGDEECDGESKPCADLDAVFIDGTAICNDSCTGYELSECVAEEPTPTVDEVIATVSESRLKEMVYYLASDELKGRKPGTTGDALSQDYIEQNFEQAGLLPLDDGSYRQPFSTDGVETANVIGHFPGVEDSEVSDEVIVVGGHFDHLGERSDGIYNGADDNASGTAVVMELAYAVGRLKKELRRTVAFMGFGAEEWGLVGSNYYCERGPVFPISKTVLMLNFDMVGRADSLTTSYQSEGASSGTDSASFKRAGVKSRGWFTGFHDDYHETSDTADKLNYPAMVNIVREAFDVLWNAAQGSWSAMTLKYGDEHHTVSPVEADLLDHGVVPYATE